MEPVLTIIAAIAPEVTQDARLNTLVSIATGRTSATAFGENKNLAIAYRALHELEMGNRAASGGGSGPVTSESEGKLSRSYGFLRSNDSYLSSTPWGEALRDLRKANISGLPASRCGGFY